MPNGNALSPPPPLPFPYLWPPRGTWDSDIKKRILNSPQLIMRWNRSGWYSVSPCLHKEILFIILCYGPGSDSRFTLTPGWDVTVKWTVRGATLTALGIKTCKHHTSIQSFWCWNMHIQSSDSPEESRERQRVQCSRHSLRKSESESDAVKTLRRKGTVRAHCSCLFKLRLWKGTTVTYSLLPKTYRQARMTSSTGEQNELICIYLLWCRTEFSSCKYSIFFMEMAS